MFQKLAKALCVVAALGSAGLAAPTAASAAEYGVSISSSGVELIRDRGHRGHGYDRRARARHGYDRGGCSPRHALNKARHFGIRNAHVRGVSRRAIVVAGRKHRDRAVVRFARVRGCPVISYR